MNETLENCPLCNNEVELTYKTFSWGVNGYVVCKTCAYKHFVEGDNTLQRITYWNTKQRIITLQNRIQKLERELEASHEVINYAMSYYKKEQEENNIVSGNTSGDAQLLYRVYDPIKCAYIMSDDGLTYIPSNCVVERGLGIYDKNHTHIFGGDVVKVYYDDNSYALFDVLWNKRQCKFEFIRHKEPGHVWQTWYTVFTGDKAPLVEVVGNIHDYKDEED